MSELPPGVIPDHRRRQAVAGIALAREQLANARRPKAVDLDEIEDDHDRIEPES